MEKVLMKNNQKGFSVVEVLLAIIALTLFVGVVAYVVDLNNEKRINTENSQSVSEKNKTNVPTEDPSANWVIFSDKDPANSMYAGTATGGDAVAISFKHPEDWQTFPVGSVIKDKADSGDNLLVPAGKTIESTGINFSSFKLTKHQTAEEYFKEIRANTTVNTGPNWEGLGGFTTKKGYSGYISRLATNPARLQIDISNKYSIASFGCNDEENGDFNTLKQIADTLEFLQ